MKIDLGREAIFVALLMVSIIIMESTLVYGEELKVGFYSQTCPLAEHIVRSTVAKAVARNPGMAAGLIRLHFHDCIVLGCDASILLDKTPQNPDSEKDDLANPLLRGFQIIDAAKTELEVQCPQTVSCADILSFAARDSVSAVGGFTYAVPGGRRDSLVPHGRDVDQNVPPPLPDIPFLKRHFEQRGLSLHDMVALSAAHSIGVAPCAAISERLYFFNDTKFRTDPSLDPSFAAFLKTKCPFGETSGGRSRTVNLDNTTPDRLDVQYYENLKKKMGVLSSDQALESDPLTAATVRRYRNNRAVWMEDFAAAMVKMGKLKVLTGDQGEIRRNCHVAN